MPTYFYRALDPQGDHVEGEAEGPSLRDVAHELKVIGYQVESLWERPPRLGMRTAFLSLFRSVSALELSLFTRQVAILLANGINLIEGLNGIKKQDVSPMMRSAIDEVIQGLEQGTGLSGALKTRPDVFSPVYVSLVRSGEVTGQLDVVLNRLAWFLERDLNLVRRIKSAMMYPILIFVVSTAIVVFMVTFVFPQFMSFFAGLNLKLPLASRILVTVTRTCQEPWFLVSLFVGLPLLFHQLHRHFVRTDLGNRQLAAAMLSLPLVGRIQSQVILARFCRTLAALLDSGVPQMVCMDVVAEAVGNRCVTDQIDRAAQRVRDEGLTLSRALGQEKFFPKMCSQLLRVGEEVGNMAPLLNRLADSYEADLELSVGKFVAVLEPLMMLVMGALVGYVLLAIFLPIYSLLDAL